MTGDVLDYDDVVGSVRPRCMDWLAETYVDALNCIHYMHDKYAYERLEMALHDHTVLRTMACGIAGLSVAADSLSAIKYAHGARRCATRPAWSSTISSRASSRPTATTTTGPTTSRSASCATFMEKVRRQPTYRDAVHTQSVLTITSNVVYGKATGNTPDGRRAGEPFAPGANPMNGRDTARHAGQRAVGREAAVRRGRRTASR